MRKEGVCAQSVSASVGMLKNVSRLQNCRHDCNSPQRQEKVEIRRNAPVRKPNQAEVVNRYDAPAKASLSGKSDKPLPTRHHGPMSAAWATSSAVAGKSSPGVGDRSGKTTSGG